MRLVLIGVLFTIVVLVGVWLVYYVGQKAGEYKARKALRSKPVVIDTPGWQPPNNSINKEDNQS